MIEIERKFLVNDLGFLQQLTGVEMTQAYLSKDPERAVRIRIAGNDAFITIKGASSTNGLSRYEWEKKIAVDEAHKLIALALPGAIHKTRYRIMSGAHTWEVDCFHNDNNGLVIAEVELSNEQEKVVLPSWVGQEVTGDQRYYNSYLSQHPYTTWTE